MAKPISVNEILAEAQAAKEAQDIAKERVRNIKKVATTLQTAGLLDDESAQKVADLFPSRAVKADDENKEDETPNDETPDDETPGDAPTE